jgi:prolipoprotein diacylglyceryltransferase
MKALAWYSIIFSVAVIIAFILFLADVLNPPTFSDLEVIIWAVAMLPLIYLGVMVLRKKD